MSFFDRTDMSSLAAIRKELKKHANPERARISRTFFKTGPGQYAEGDIFIGASVPVMRKIAGTHRDLAEHDILALLTSPVHEERLTALIIIVEQCKRGDEKTRSRWYRVYLRNAAYVNNWDLVDCSAEYVVGAYLVGKDHAPLLRLARSKQLWERRIAMVACFAFIKRKEHVTACKIAELLVYDEHDLIQKAVGWMLREVGKRCGRGYLEVFLDRFAATMPRTMLRYALEHFPAMARTRYMVMAKRS